MHQEKGVDSQKILNPVLYTDMVDAKIAAGHCIDLPNRINKISV
jgi:hypothetical protein